MTGAERRAGRPARPFEAESWCEVLREAKESQRMSYDQLALETRYNRGKLVETMTGQRRPSIEELLKIAAVLRLSQVRMLDIAGHLPGLTNMLAYVDRLEDLASLTGETHSRLPFAGVQGAAAIVDRVAATGEFRVAVNPLVQGTGVHRVHYADIVVIEPLGDDLGEQETRERLTRLLFDEFTWFCAGFVDRPASARGFGARFPSLAVQVPRFIAARRTGSTPLPGVPHSVCVIGSHWSGAEDMASLLAAAFGHDFTPVTEVASRTFSRINHARTLFAHDKMGVAMTYLAGAAIGRMRTWATDAAIYVHMACALSGNATAREPFVIHLRSTDALLEWTAHARELWHIDTPVADNLREEARERAAVDRLLAPIRQRVLTVPVGLPAGVDLARPDEDGRDGFMTLWCDTAEEIIARLKAEHGMWIDVDEALSRARSFGRSTEPRR